MRTKAAVLLGCLAAGVLALGVARRSFWAQVSVRDRVTQEIDSTLISRVPGNVPPQARPEYDQGPVDSSFPLNRVVMVFKPTGAQQSDLNALLDAQQDPSSPDFHQWLSPDEYADRFGLSANDLAKVVAWLDAQGFTVVQTARSRTWVAFSGTAAQVSAAFHTGIHRYQVGGETHFSNDADPSVPSALAGVVLGFRSLNDFRPRPRQLRIRHVVAGPGPRFTSSTSGEHFLAPYDFATIYGVEGLYHSGITGSGRKIAVMGQTDFAATDISAFRKASGLAVNPPTVVLVPGSPDPGTRKNDVGEADLDLEWAGAVAPDAGIVYVNSTDVFESLQYAVDQNLAPVITISYGQCEKLFDPTGRGVVAANAMQANAQGITVMAATGDSGAADCDSGSPSSPAKLATQGLAVDFPSSLPYVTGVGGTRFDDGSGNYWTSTNNSANGSALSYIPEEAWNDSVQDNGLAATGGGASTFYPKPGWQWGTGVPDDGARDVPDVALSGSADHDGYLICSQGSCVDGFRAADNTLMIVGGTSVGAPSFAGLVALIDQKEGAAQGNINYVLYPLAARSSDAFHDVTIGNNKVACKLGSTDCPNAVEIGYSAGAGYDQTTGLGSVNAFNLATAWASVTPAPRGSEDFQLTAAPAALTISAGTTSNATVTLTPQNKFTGAVALTCSVASALSGVTCSISPGSLTTSGTAMLTVKVPAAGAGGLLAPGFGRSPGWPALALAFALALSGAGLLALSCRRGGTPSLGPWGASRSRPPLRRLGLGLALAGLLAAGLSCGGGSSPTTTTTTHTAPPPVTGKVTVQGVSGNLHHLTDVNVTAN